VIEELIDRFSGPNIAIWGPFLFLLLCAFGFPMPEDIILVVAGVLGAKYGHSFFTIAFVTYWGILLGDTFIFMMGTFFGRRILKTKFGSLLIKEKTRLKAVRALENYGSWVVFGARFLPGLRTAVFFTSGTLHFPVYKFLLMDGVAALISAPLFVYVGSVFWGLYRENFSEMEGALGEAKFLILAGVALLVLFLVSAYFVHRFLRRKGLE